MQIREYDEVTKKTAPAVFLYPVVLLHEQELSHDAGHARALQGHEPEASLVPCPCRAHVVSLAGRTNKPSRSDYPGSATAKLIT